MSVLPSFAERKRIWVFRRCTLSLLFSVKLILNILICAVAPDFGSGSASLHGSFRVRGRRGSFRVQGWG